MDDEFVLAARSGDVPAFDRLARDRIDRLYAIAFRILRDHHDAEDAVQQALWTAWQDLPGLADVSRFDPWLYRVLVHACYRAGRRDRRHGRVLRLVPELDAPRSDDTGTVDDREEIDSAFRSLGPEHRAVVVLHHYVGLPLVEVAEALGIPAGTARSRLHYAHALLRDRIRPDHRSATGGA